MRKFKDFVSTALGEWWSGVLDACAIHRTFKYFKESRAVLVKTGRCFVCNGFIFLGSMALVHLCVLPCTKWLLAKWIKFSSDLWEPPINSSDMQGTLEDYESRRLQAIVAGFEPLLLQFYNWLWLYPYYVLSYVVNCSWYNDIAHHGFQVEKKVNAVLTGKPVPSVRRRTVGQLVGEELYRVVLFMVFMVQVMFISKLPLMLGDIAYLLMLSWLYAYYCFDYKVCSTNRSTHYAFNGLSSATSRKPSLCIQRPSLCFPADVFAVRFK
ncbi:hypothetical protein CYMTET_28654 [Cymbomonas tetramitiformis]|uniref:Uncharacterized protein n=1 Tax=Cymbomonas tetramitiformis TaxID=36881 RepID=A0AAE0FMH9_9CHLO|nr:hypothetical protein CYMTET_28654 [Cymbomonas tetramitiformis]